MAATAINARKVVGMGFPPIEGERLATWLLKQELPAWAGITMDVRGCPPGLLISAFFNAFLQRISEAAPERLDDAKAIVWLVQFPFQEKNVAEWVEAFRPVR